MRISDQEFTRLRVLKILRRTEPISRTRLARLCGLTGTTITEIVSDLIQRELVVEEKISTGARGRPRLDLRINSQGGFVIAAFIDLDGMLQVDFVDLGGRRVFSYSTPITATKRLDVLAHQIADIVVDAIAAAPIPKTAIKNAAVALPAMVDSRNGQIVHFETFEPDPCFFADIIERRLQIPTAIEGSANALARAEYWFGDSLDQDDLITVAFSIGLALAHYKEGFISAGAHSVNPELGHVKVAISDGRLCTCGARGCLQAYSSISAILDQVSERSGEAPVPYPYLEWEPPLRRHIASAISGEGLAREVIEDAGHCLGVAISNLINFHDPDRIIVFFKVPELIDLMTGPLHEALENNTLRPLRGRTAVELRALDNNHFWKGAAAMALEQFFRTR